MIKIAKFNIGERVRHLQHGYLAVIIDIDPLFQASGRYNPQAIKRSFATKNPWYRLLVDGGAQIAYAEECKLVAEHSAEKIDNSHLEEYLIEQPDGYRSCVPRH